MSVQDDKAAGQEEDQRATEKSVDKDADNDSDSKADGQPTEKPEPGEDQNKAAAEMMTAYEDRPTLVLPGSGGMVSGTAVNDWLDDEGNPKYEVPDREGSEANSDDKAKSDEAQDDEAKKEQVEKDKALNEELKKASAEENKGEKTKS